MSQTVVDDVLQVVVFSLKDNASGRKEHYAISVEQVREIILFETITTIPNTEKYVKGIVNLRGKIIPIIDVKEKIGFDSSSKNNTKSYILVAEIKEMLTGFLIDEADQVMRVLPKDIEMQLSDDLGSVTYVKGIIKVDRRLIVLLDVLKLLTGKEIHQYR